MKTKTEDMYLIRILNPETKETQVININGCTGESSILARQVTKRMKWDIESPNFFNNGEICSNVSELNDRDTYEVRETKASYT